MSCKEDTCGGKKVNARCVDYEGEVSKCSGEVDECKKRTVHGVLEDNSQQLTEICRQLDMSGVEPSCLEIQGDKPEVKDYIQAIINKVCDAQFDCEKMFNTTVECSGLDYKCFVDECNEEFKPSNLKQLFQMLIDRSCQEEEGEGEEVNVLGGENIEVTQEDIGGVKTFIISQPNKEYFYQENIEEISLNGFYPPGYSGEWIMPSQYNTLTYQNTRSTSMTVEVHVSYEESTGVIPETIGAYNQISSAIIKVDATANQTEQYMKEGDTALSLVVYNNSTGQPTTEQTVQATGGVEAKIRVSPNQITMNTSYFKIVDLLPGEEVSLMFRGKSVESVQNLSRAQILVKEL